MRLSDYDPQVLTCLDMYVQKDPESDPFSPVYKVIVANFLVASYSNMREASSHLKSIAKAVKGKNK